VAARKPRRDDGVTGTGPPVLSPRLTAVADLIPRGARVVDLGSGHGLLPQQLLACGRAGVCIATERDRRTAARLRHLEATSGLEIRVGDGLAALKPGDDVDVLVMAGLGARSMLRILSAGRFDVTSLRRLVLQPQTESGLLRRWLVEKGRTIVDERMVVDRGRFYVAIAAEPRRDAQHPSHPVLSFDDLMDAGPCLVRRGGPVMRRYWSRTLRRLDRVLETATARTDRTRARRGRELAVRVLALLEPEKGVRLV